MATGWSDKVRQFAYKEYVEPARGNRSRIRIHFGEFQDKLEKIGFPQQHPNQAATSIESGKFWGPIGLEMCSPKGQSRKKDTIFEFRFVDEALHIPKWVPEDDPLLKLSGVLKGAICEGADAFVKAIRKDKEVES